MGRCSDNEKIEKEPDWLPSTSLREGMVDTYRWIEEQVRRDLADERERRACSP